MGWMSWDEWERVLREGEGSEKGGRNKGGKREEDGES